MHAYSDYAGELERASRSPSVATTSSADLLSDSAMRRLRDVVPIETLRKKGVFFTSSELAATLWSDALAELDATSTIVDPAVGAGDLLLPAVEHLRDVEGSDVNRQFSGWDIEPVFVRVARRRLQLASRGSAGDMVGLQVADFLGDAMDLSAATHVVLNPPFSPMIGPAGGPWAGSSVNSAAIFVVTALERMRVGGRLLALLPDVLRSGSSYQGWRQMVASRAERIVVRPLGQFDNETDVHVFVLDMTVGPGAANRVWPANPAEAQHTVGDYFDISVGAVVPHRHADSGTRVPFLSARELAGETELHSVSTTRGFSGRMNKGPMVLVRRTSRPGEAMRAKATLVLSEMPIAIENHLIVLAPRDGTLEACRALIRMLADPRTTTFLDERIRCRHLTVSSVREIPWGASP